MLVKSNHHFRTQWLAYDRAHQTHPVGDLIYKINLYNAPELNAQLGSHRDEFLISYSTHTRNDTYIRYPPRINFRSLRSSTIGLLKMHIIFENTSQKLHAAWQLDGTRKCCSLPQVTISLFRPITFYYSQQFKLLIPAL